jgi:hypothetical protein
MHEHRVACKVVYEAGCYSGLTPSITHAMTIFAWPKCAPGAGVVPVPSLMSSIFKPLELVMNFEPSLAAHAGYSGRHSGDTIVPIATSCSICRLAAQGASGFGAGALCAHAGDAAL